MGSGVSQPVAVSHRPILQPATSLWSVVDELLIKSNANREDDVQNHVVALSREQRQSLNKGNLQLQEDDLTAKLQHDDEYDYDPSEAGDQLKYFVCPYCGPHQTFLFEAAFQHHMRVSFLVCVIHF